MHEVLRRGKKSGGEEKEKEEPPIVIAGQPAEKHMVLGRGKENEMFVLKNIRVLALSSDTNSKEILDALGDEFHTWRHESIYGFEHQGVIVIEGPQDAQDIGQKLKKNSKGSSVEWVGRIVYFDQSNLASVAALTDQIIVELHPNGTEDQLHTFNDSVGFEILRKTPFVAGQYVLHPKERLTDSLNVVAVAKRYKSCDAIKPERILHNWVAPIELRR